MEKEIFKNPLHEDSRDALGSEHEELSGIGNKHMVYRELNDEFTFSVEKFKDFCI